MAFRILFIAHATDADKGIHSLRNIANILNKLQKLDPGVP